MFIANYGLKALVQKTSMFLRLPVDYSEFHPYRALQVKSLEDTLQFIGEKMPNALAFDTPKELMAHALKQVAVEGIFAEFGVNEGGSVNFIASQCPKRAIDGFDSFEGLPENWSGNNMAAGYFSRGGQLPKVRSNVTLHRGWFDQSLPKFLSETPGNAAFLHIDCDLYSSTKTIFEQFATRIVPGTVLVFDEYFNYPNWRAHEHKAFEEFVAANGIEFEFLAYSFRQVSAIVRGRKTQA